VTRPENTDVAATSSSVALAGMSTVPVANGQIPAMARNTVDLPGPGWAGDQGALVAAKADAVGAYQRRAVGQLDQELSSAMAPLAGGCVLHDVGIRRQRLGMGNRSFTTVKTRDDRLPFGASVR